MKITEIIAKLKTDNPSLLPKRGEGRRAVNVLRAVLDVIREEIENTESGIIRIGALGSFQIKTFKRTNKEGQEETRRTVIFTPQEKEVVEPAHARASATACSPSDLFNNKVGNLERMGAFQRALEGKKPYVVFFTARSGSSFLSDLLKRTTVAGRPGEYFNPRLMPGILSGIKRSRVPSVDTITDYLLWLLENRSTENGAFGFKVTYLHYLPFILGELDDLFFSKFKAFYLYRKNIVKQAVSLYVATETGLFHKTKELPDELISKADTLLYNAEKIRDWIVHVWDQEKSLNDYFARLKTDVQVFEYQQLSENPDEIVRAILRGIDVPADVTISESSYKKVRGSRNDALAAKFLDDPENGPWLEKLGIPASRLEGE